MSLLLAASLFTAVAPPAPAPAATAAGPAGADPSQVICRRYRESGTRLVVRRSCMTRQEWAALRRALRQDVDRAQLTRVISPQ